MNAPCRTALSLSTFFLATAAAHANIIRWDNSRTIPGTQSISLAPNVDLTGKNIPFALLNTDLTHANFDKTNLSHAEFTSSAILTGANFTKATLLGASFNDPAGFTFAQLASTASYAKKSLQQIKLIDLSLPGAALAKQNLSNSTIQNSDLAAADLTKANLTKAAISSDLTNALLVKANLSKARFDDATLTSANFSGAIIANANFDGSDLTLAQLATTANYTRHNLSNVNLSDLDLTAANFTKVTLTKATFNDTLLANSNLTKAVVTSTNFTDADFAGANFAKIKLTKTNFSEADLRAATGFLPFKNTLTTNAILTDGAIHGLTLTPAEKLTIRNNTLPITVNTTATLDPGSTLQFILALNWTSPIGFSPSVTPALGGALDLEFPLATTPASVAGHSFQLFNWNTAPTLSNQFTAITTDPRLAFDLSQLYTTGIITVALPSGTPASPGTPAPEPASLLLLTPALLLLKSRRPRT